MQIHRQTQHDFANWRDFLTIQFPQYVKFDFAPHHIEFWNWIWAIRKDERPRPFVALWARGGAKSSAAELATALVTLTERRRYVLYVSGTQENADKHVATIAAMLESVGIARALNKYGASRGWRRNRLMLANGATIDALGLDTTLRGVKVEEQRPDFQILDDVDERHDTAETTRKKIETLTQSVLPTGSSDCGVAFVQNLIHRDSIAARLADGRADFLSDRTLSGPHPAIRDLQLDGRTIIGGTPTWCGQNIEICQAQIATWGLAAFRREAQHEIAEADNGLWQREYIEKYRLVKAPELTRIVVGVDPPGGTRTECGIIADGLATTESIRHIYVLEDASRAGTPDEWARAVVTLYHKIRADCIVAEQNFGGEMVRATIQHVDANVPVVLVNATRGKIPRAEPIATLSQEGREHFVGAFPLLEEECCSYIAGMPSPNRMDAHVWAATELIAREYWYMAEM